MTRRAFRKIKAGLDDALAFAEERGDRSAYRVHVPKTIDVKAIRARLGLSQTAFAARFGFTTAAVREWEYGRRQPERSARVLLAVIAREPEAVDRALRKPV